MSFSFFSWSCPCHFLEGRPKCNQRTVIVYSLGVRLCTLCSRLPLQPRGSAVTDDACPFTRSKSRIFSMDAKQCLPCLSLNYSFILIEVGNMLKITMTGKPNCLIYFFFPSLPYRTAFDFKIILAQHRRQNRKLSSDS